MWQAGMGDAAIGGVLAATLTASGHRALAERVSAMHGTELAAFGPAGPWGRRKGMRAWLEWLRLAKPDLTSATAKAPSVKLSPQMTQDGREQFLTWALSPYASTPEAWAAFLPRGGTPAQREAAWQGLIENVRRDYEIWRAWRLSHNEALRQGRRPPSPPSPPAWRPPKR
jgi:hypothetical protein